MCVFYFINWTNLLLENYIAFSFLPSAEHGVHISYVCCALCDQFCMGYLLFHQMFYWFRYFSFRSPSPWLHFLLNMWCTFLLRVYTFVLCNLRGECKRVLFAAFFNSTWNSYRFHPSTTVIILHPNLSKNSNGAASVTPCSYIVVSSWLVVHDL